MRVYHQLTGCSRYIANPYQFGADNDEALQSGAFWFYYRLGYRPVDATVRKLAKTEWHRVCSDKMHRSNIRTLRRLASCDMHFTLPGARGIELVAPFVAAAEPSTWPKDAHQAVRKILQAKGAASELDFARRMCGHDHFLQSLRKRCRQADR